MKYAFLPHEHAIRNPVLSLQDNGKALKRGSEIKMSFLNGLWLLQVWHS